MSKSFLPQDFMERVVTWPGPDGPGFVNMHWLSPTSKGGFYGRPFKNLQDFMDLAQRAAVKPSVYKEIFFCLSTQKTTGKIIHGNPVAFRHRNQVQSLKALWIDVDVKPEKGYPTLDLAMAAITAFVVAADLPTPSAIVFSGGGVHVYWISDKPLTKDEWEPYATGLRAEIQKHGLKCDAGLTTDAARVLRVPGTYNNKLSTPRPVLLKWLGDSYSFDTEPRIARLATLVVISMQPKVTGAVTKATFDMSAFTGGMAPGFVGVLDPQSESISDGINLHADLPLDPREVFRGCLHYRESLRTGGKMASQGLWMNTVLGATFFENGREIAHAIGDKYPTYSRGETDAMFDRKVNDRADHNLGWPSCHAFEGEGAKCKTCPFYGKIRSPLNLAKRVAAPLQMIPVAPPPPEELSLPPGYALNDDGCICEIGIKTYAGGAQEEVLQQLFYSQIRSPVTQAGRRAIMFETSLDMDNWGPVTLVEADLAGDQAMLKSLRTQGVKTFVRNEGKIRHFMTSWLDKLDKAKARILTVPYGWLREGVDGTGQEIGFAYGGRVFMRDGTEQQAGYSDPQLEKFYQPRGDIKVWHECHKMITDQHRPSLEAIMALAFAAPLVSLTGKHNAVMCGWSRESGAHKSTAELVGLGIWGNPRLTKESPMSSIKGIIHKLGTLKNLPIYWDEISDEEKMDKVRGLLNLSTEGGGATNLTQARTFFEKDEWQTLMFVGANRSLCENIMRHVKDTDAHLQRVFEFYCHKMPDSLRESDVSVLINSLDYNYGKVGLQYAAYLGHNPQAVRDLVMATVRRLDDQVQQASEERFRSSMVACVYAGAQIGNEKLGCSFDLPALWDFLVAEYLNQRRNIKESEIVGGTLMNTLNALTQFFKAHARNTLWVNTLPMKKAGRPPAVTWIAGPSRDHPDRIDVRMAVNDRVIEISRERLGEYLERMDKDINSVITGLQRHCGATIVKDKVDLAAGAQVNGGREVVLRIPVPAGSPFLTNLLTHASIEEREELGVRDEAAVTATVTDDAPFQTASQIEESVKQATKDLDVVRKATP